MCLNRDEDQVHKLTKPERISLEINCLNPDVLKGQFTQKWRFTLYLLTPILNNLKSLK